MTIDRIKYEETFPTSVQYKNIRLTAEASLSEDDNVSECYQKLKDSVRDSYLSVNPDLLFANSEVGFFVPNGIIEKEASSKWQPEPPQPKDTISTLLDHINSCTELKVLESYKLIVKKDPSLQQAFDKKMEELKNK